MNKIYCFLVLAILAAAGIYSAKADESGERDVVLNPTADDGWKVFSGSGNSGTTFVSTTAHKPTGGTYSYSLWNYSATQKDVWLSTPAMQLTAGVSYSLELMYQTWNPFVLSNFEIYVTDTQVSNATTATEVQSLTPIYRNALTGNKNEWLPLSIENSIYGEGTKYVVFHVSGECQGRFSIASVMVYGTAASATVPMAPTGLTADATPGELEVGLSWTLPTENADGQPLIGENAITAVNVYRDDAKIATVEGAATSFTDTEATGLAKGPHSYSVSVVAGDVEGNRCEPVEVSWVGPWSFSQNEVTVSTENPAPDNAWSFSRNNTSITVRSNSANPSNGFTNSVQTWNNSSLSDLNVWISSPRLDIPVGRTFKVSFYYRFNPNSDTEVTSLKAFLSPAKASASEQDATTALNGTVLLDTSATKGSVSTSTPWQHIVIKGLSTSETPMYLNFNLTGTVCKGIYISGLEVEEYVEKPFVPAAPTDLTATAAGNQQLSVALNWTNPTMDIDGVEFTDHQTVQQVYIYRDDFETPAVTLEGNVTTFTDDATTGLTPGAHTYRVKVMVQDAVSGFSNEATVSYVGPVATQSLPWIPLVTNLSNNDFSTLWISYSPFTYTPMWTNRPAGIFLMNSTQRSNDAWLISAPLDMVAGQSYKIEYQISTNATELTPTVQIGIVDSTTPSEFITFATVQFGEQQSVTLTLPEQAVTMLTDNSNYRLAVRDVTTDPDESYNLTLKYLSVSINTNQGTGVGINTDDSASVVAVYDLAGRKVATDTANVQDGGAYIVRLSNGKSKKIVIRK